MQSYVKKQEANTSHKSKLSLNEAPSLWVTNRSFYLRFSESRKKQNEQMKLQNIEKLSLDPPYSGISEKHEIDSKLKIEKSSDKFQIPKNEMIEKEIVTEKNINQGIKNLKTEKKQHQIFGNETVTTDVMRAKGDIEETECLRIDEQQGQLNKNDEGPFLTISENETFENDVTVAENETGVTESLYIEKHEEMSKQDSEETPHLMAAIEELRELLVKKDVQITSLEKMLQEPSQSIVTLTKPSDLPMTHSDQNYCCEAITSDSTSVSSSNSQTDSEDSLENEDDSYAATLTGSASFTILPQPSGLPLHYHNHELMENLIRFADGLDTNGYVSKQMGTNTNEFGCQTDIWQFFTLNRNKRSSSTSTEFIETYEESTAAINCRQPHFICRLAAFFAQSIFTTVLLEYYDEQKLDIDRMVSYHVIPSLKRMFA